MTRDVLDQTLARGLDGVLQRLPMQMRLTIVGKRRGGCVARLRLDFERVAEEPEVDPDEMHAAYYENDEIPLRQLMEEQFYLSLPMKPLCKDDCKGLCANCGTNLNKATCDCNTQWEDPRLAALRDLKKES